MGSDIGDESDVYREQIVGRVRESGTFLHSTRACQQLNVNENRIQVRDHGPTPHPSLSSRSVPNLGFRPGNTDPQSLSLPFALAPSSPVLSCLSCFHDVF